MYTIIRYTLLTASRDWLFIGLFVAVLAAYGLAIFTGGASLVEQQQMILSYFAGTSRFILIIGLIVFICFHIRRSFENREIESILSKPISRTKFVIAYWMGFTTLAAIATLPVFVILLFFTSPDIQGLLFWSISFLLEASLVVAFALLSALILQSAVSAVLSCFAFYFISRLMGFFVSALEDPYSFISGKSGLYSILNFTLKAVSTVIPRLDMFAKSSWLVHGVTDPHDLFLFFSQAFVYIFLLIGMALFDFKRKQF